MDCQAKGRIACKSVHYYKDVTFSFRDSSGLLMIKQQGCSMVFFRKTKLSHKINNVNAFLYFKESLQYERISAKDVLIYVRDFRWSKTFQNIVDAIDINRLGEMTQTLPHIRQYAVQFFMLAAKRGSSWGSANCVPYFLHGDKDNGIEPSIKKALYYAQRAVELANNQEDANEHKFLLSRIMRANHGYVVTANALLVEYITFKKAQLKNSNNTIEKEKLEKALNDYQHILKNMEKRLNQLKQNKFLATQVAPTAPRIFNRDLAYWRCICAKRIHFIEQVWSQNGRRI